MKNQNPSTVNENTNQSAGQSEITRNTPGFVFEGFISPYVIFSPKSFHFLFKDDETIYANAAMGNTGIVYLHFCG